MSKELTQKVVVRRVDDIITGTRTGTDAEGRPVTAGWAMGAFYKSEDGPFTESFEVKEWGSEQKYGPGTATFRPTWHAHDETGNEYLRVVAGELTVFLGEKVH